MSILRKHVKNQQKHNKSALSQIWIIFIRMLGAYVNIRISILVIA